MAFSFGSPNPAPAPATGGFSFGSTSTPASAPAAGGFSFGSAAKSPAPAPPSGGFSFGGGSTTAFGAAAASTTPAPAPAAGAFSFGSTATPAPAAAPVATPGSSFFGSAPAPASTPATNGQQPAVIGPISSSSVYSTLPPQAQAVIDQIYNHALRNQRTIATIKTLEPRLLDKTNLAGSGHVEEEKKSSDATTTTIDEASDLYLPIQIESLQTQLQTVTTSIEHSLARVQELQSQSRKTASEVLSEGVWPMEALAARRGIQLTYFDTTTTTSDEKQKMERKMEHMLDREAALVDRREQIPSEFMWNFLKELESRAAEIQQNVDLLQNQLDVVIRSNKLDNPDYYNADGAGYGRPKERRVTGEEISEIFKSQNDALLRVAGAVATVHDQLDALRARWRRYHGTADDPFRKADAEEILERNRLEAKRRADMALARPPAPAPAPAATTSGGLFGASSAPAPATGGLFGAPAPAPSSGGLFGAAAPAPATGGLFGSTTTPAPAPATGGLFGTSTPAAPAPATGGLFGTPAPAPAAGSLFGAAAPAPAASGGLFGTPAPAPAPGGLFGSTPAPAGGGGLFGAAAPAPATGGLFGATPAPAPSTGLFGGGGGGALSTSKPRSKNKSRSRR